MDYGPSKYFVLIGTQDNVPFLSRFTINYSDSHWLTGLKQGRSQGSHSEIQRGRLLNVLSSTVTTGNIQFQNSVPSAKNCSVVRIMDMNNAEHNAGHNLHISHSFSPQTDQLWKLQTRMFTIPPAGKFNRNKTKPKRGKIK